MTRLADTYGDLGKRKNLRNLGFKKIYGYVLHWKFDNRL